MLLLFPLSEQFAWFFKLAVDTGVAERSTIVMFNVELVSVLVAMVPTRKLVKSFRSFLVIGVQFLEASFGREED